MKHLYYCATCDCTWFTSKEDDYGYDPANILDAPNRIRKKCPECVEKKTK